MPSFGLILLSNLKFYPPSLSAKAQNTSRLVANPQALVSTTNPDEAPGVEEVEQSKTLEPIVPSITSEEKEEEYMAANLRADFRERQQERLSIQIVVGPSSAKKLKTGIEKGSFSKPCPTPFTVYSLFVDCKQANGCGEHLVSWNRGNLHYLE